MRLSIRILGSEVFGIDTTPYEQDASPGDVTTAAFGFGGRYIDKHDEHEETP